MAFTALRAAGLGDVFSAAAAGVGRFAFYQLL